MRSTPPSALLISPSQQDHDFLHALFSEEGWILHSASSLAPASAILRRAVVEALITEADLPFGTWKDVLSVMELLASRPMVIVTSLHADDALWAEALSHGAYDVLAKPFNKTELVCVLNSVWNRNIVRKLALRGDRIMATRESRRVANADVIPIRPRTAVTHQVVENLDSKHSALARRIRSAAHNWQRSPNGRRSEWRFPIAVEVEYKVDGSDRKIGRVVNLSSKGILFAATDRVAVGKRIQLLIAWPIKLDGKVRLTLWATGQVVRNDGQHIAVHLSRHEFRTARICASGSS